MNNCPKTPGIERQIATDLDPLGVKVPVYTDPGMWGWGRETASVSSGPQPPSTQATRSSPLVTWTVCTVRAPVPISSLISPKTLTQKVR